MKISIPVQFQTVIESTIIAIFPTALIEILGNALDIKLLNDNKVLVILLSYLFTSIVTFFLMNYFDNQQLKKYKGKWVEIIPKANRKISICEIFIKRI